MRIAVLCEFSGIVRDAFLRHGHDAISCDLLPTESPGPHIIGDCRDHDWSTFDLVIAHPPCTYLCSSGIHWNRRRPSRAALTDAAAVFFLWCTQQGRANCTENPVGVMSTRFRKPNQIIQPYHFGHPESKATCLWLRNLPPLTPTNLLVSPTTRWSNQTPTGQNRLGPSPNRWKIRSLTYSGIAEAMATQWSHLKE